MSSTVNALVHTEANSITGDIGALWHLFDIADHDKHSAFLCNKVGLDKLTFNLKHMQNIFLDGDTLEALQTKANQKLFTIIQKPGNIVSVPSEAPH